MSNAMIKKMAKEWLSNYTTDHLNHFAGQGEVLKEQKHWCRWLRSELGNLIESFHKYLIETKRFPASPTVLK